MAKDKAKAKAGPVSGDRIKSFIERAEKLLEERKAIQQDIGDVFHEAKGVGYDVKTMRKLITVRAMDQADRAEQETLLDTYAHAIGMEPISGSMMPSEEDLIEHASRVVIEVDQCVALVLNGEPPKIADIQKLIGCSLGKASKLRGLVADRISRMETDEREMKNENVSPDHRDDMTEADLGDPLWVIDKPRAQFRENVRAAAASVKPSVIADATPTITDDQALSAMEEARLRLLALKRERGMPA